MSASLWPTQKRLYDKVHKKDREGHCIINEDWYKGILHLYSLTYIHQIYEVPKHIRQILTDIKRKVDRNIIIVGDCDTPLTAMDKSFR